MAYEEYRKAYRIKHAKHIRKYMREYFTSHKKEKREYDIEYRKRNKEHIKKLKHERYLKNKKKILDRHREYSRRTGIYRWRSLGKYETWRQSVYTNANYTCQQCGATNCKVIAHHIKPAKEYPELRYDVNNGLCVCKECHHKIHYE